jgi:hypothetical protein
MGDLSHSVADTIEERLAVYLGVHTAKVAVRTFAERSLGRGPETLTPKDIPSLIEALRPMMRTLIGKRQSEAIIEQLLQEFA